MQPFSQGILNSWQTCPRQFQYKYLEGLLLPANPIQQERMGWGSQFHWLMQQAIAQVSIPDRLGTPEIAAVPPTHLDHSAALDDRDLQQAIATTLTALTQWLDRTATDHPWQLDAEHRRTWIAGDRPITVVYDLLAVKGDRAQIFDWKTYAQPVPRDRLARDWQTRLYLYLLAETIDLPPDRLSMSYWFVRPVFGASASNPAETTETTATLHEETFATLHEETFAYSDRWHRQIQGQLTEAIAQIDRALVVHGRGESLAQVPVGDRACQTCAFASRCQRSKVIGFPELVWQEQSWDQSRDQTWDQILEAIEEVAL